MKIGIVILNYNDSTTTIELLKKIKDYEALYKIAVVDNNSRDNSYSELLKYESEKIKIIKAEENRGYSAGNNIGVRCLQSENIDYVIISNPDIIFEENDILKLCENFKDKQIAVVAPRINEHGIINRGWKFQNTFLDAMTNINFIGRYFKKKRLYKQEHYNTNISKVDVVSGCFFVIRMSCFEEINGFDENVFLYYEENILAKKINKLSKNIIIDNTVEVFHNHSVTIDKSLNKIKKFKALAKSQRYYNKMYNNAGFCGMILLYITYYISLGISYFLRIFNK